MSVCSGERQVRLVCDATGYVDEWWAESPAGRHYLDGWDLQHEPTRCPAGAHRIEVREFTEWAATPEEGDTEAEGPAG